MTLIVAEPAGVDREFVHQAQQLSALIESRADECDRIGTMPTDVVDALRSAGLFTFMVPKEVGGAEVNAITAIRVFEELTAADASIGWSFMANASTSAMCAYLGDDAVATMCADGPLIAAGQFSPKGPAFAEPEGYRVAGHYSFGSGSAHANWMGGGTVEMDGGAPQMVDGRPVIRAFFVPQSEVEFLGNWDVMGLIGTGSYDYAVSERVVPEQYTFVLTDPTVHRGGTLYQLGVLGMTAAGHAGFALGASRRAVNEVVALAGRKQRLGHATTVAGVERFQYELGRHTAMLRAARAFVYDVFSRVQDALEPGVMVSDEARATLRQATTHVTHVSAAVVDFAYHWSGADGIRPGTLQRVWRDIHTSTQHIFVDDNTFTDVGRQLLVEAGSLPS